MGGQLGGCCGDIGDLELDGGVRDGHLGRPVGQAETGSGGVSEGPHLKVLDPPEAVDSERVARDHLERQTEDVLVERPCGSGVGDDRREPCDEEDFRDLCLPAPG